MDISTQVMKYVCAVAKYLSFHKAADACFTSQPNLSAQIKKLEAELGYDLFERTSRFVKTSKKGELVVREFLSILEKVNALTELNHSQFSGTLKLGLFPTLAPYLLPKVMMGIKKNLPDLKLTVIEDKTKRLCEQLEAGDLDCILVAYPEHYALFEHELLFEDRFYVAISVENALAQQAELRLEDIKNETVLLLEDGHCLRDQALEICQADFLNVDFSYKSASLETLRAMVSVNAGITFMPELCILPSPHIKYLPLKDKQYSRTIALYWRKTSSQKALIKNLAKQLVVPGY